MLKIELHNALLNKLQDVKNSENRPASTDWAALIGKQLRLFPYRLELFRETQERAGGNCLLDATPASISDVRSGRTPFGYPKKAGRLVTNLDFSHMVQLPEKPPSFAPEGPNLRSLDPHSYLCPTSLELRSLSENVCAGLVLYLHPLRTAYIVWIGKGRYLSDAAPFIHAETTGLTDFSEVAPDYHSWLLKNRNEDDA